MKLLKVKIIASKLDTYWYADKIEQEFYVYNVPNSEFGYQVVMEGVWEDMPGEHYLKKDSVEIIEAFKADIVQEIKIMIKR